MKSKYKDCMEDLMKRGYATKAQPAEVPGKTWYLPHHAVQHPAKPGKVCVVFDCFTKYHGKSLNDELLQGLDLTNSLVGVLITFRQDPVAFMSDVEAMFHEVRVNPRRLQCFTVPLVARWKSGSRARRDHDDRPSIWSCIFP